MSPNEHKYMTWLEKQAKRYRWLLENIREPDRISLGLFSYSEQSLDDAIDYQIESEEE